jgi:hypothetical protein
MVPRGTAVGTANTIDSSLYQSAMNVIELS